MLEVGTGSKSKGQGKCHLRGFLGLCMKRAQHSAEVIDDCESQTCMDAKEVPATHGGQLLHKHLSSMNLELRWPNTDQAEDF